MDELAQNTQKACLILMFCLISVVVLFLTGTFRCFFLYLECCTTILTGLQPNFLINIGVQREKQKCFIPIETIVLIRPS